MPSTLTVKRYLRYTLNGFLIIGLVFVVGFLSFAGMLALGGPIFAAILAFFFAGGVEGEVYAQNINQSLLSLFTNNYVEDLILNRHFEQLLTTENCQSVPFLQDYLLQKKYIHELEEREKLTEEEETLLDAAKARLIVMQCYVNHQYHLAALEANKQGTTNTSSELNKPLSALFQGEHELGVIQNEIDKKCFWGRVTWAINILVGITAGLVALEAAQTSLIALSVYFGFAISSAAMTGGIVTLAILAAVGYTFLIHRTLTDMIYNDTLQRWVKEAGEFLKQRENETNGFYILRVIGGGFLAVLVVGLAVFATVATAGTWWYAAKKGAEILPYIMSAAEWLRNILVPIMGITTLLFSIVNSFRSLKNLFAISIPAIFKFLIAKIKKQFNDESLVQFLNPFRFLVLLISMPFKFVFFIGHLISVGLMGDRLEGVPPWLLTMVGAASDALVDANYFIPEGEHQGGHHHSDKEDGESSDQNETSQLLQNKKESHKEAGNCEDENHEHKEELSFVCEEEHDHSHADLLGKFLFIILAPVSFLEACWDFFFGFITAEKKEKEEEKEEEKLYSTAFCESLDKSFNGISEPRKPVPEKPKISDEWGIQEEKILTNSTTKEIIELKTNFYQTQL